MSLAKRVRRFGWPIILLILLISLIGNGWSAVERWQRTRVVSVPDGDSLQLKDGRRIRLLGIDAPERGRCMASEAREKLVALALGRHVWLKNIVTDNYGRSLPSSSSRTGRCRRPFLPPASPVTVHPLAIHTIKC